MFLQDNPSTKHASSFKNPIPQTTNSPLKQPTLVKETTWEVKKPTEVNQNSYYDPAGKH